MLHLYNNFRIRLYKQSVQIFKQIATDDKTKIHRLANARQGFSTEPTVQFAEKMCAELVKTGS